MPEVPKRSAEIAWRIARCRRVPDAHAVADRLRAEFSEIATVAAQAARLGIEIDAADAMRRGLKPDALRQTILDRLAVRSEAADVSPSPRNPPQRAAVPSSSAPASGRRPAADKGVLRCLF